MTRLDYSPIPQPKPTLLVGNLPDVDAQQTVLSLMELAREHGPIFQLHLLSPYLVVVVSSHELVDELCDKSRSGSASAFSDRSSPSWLSYRTSRNVPGWWKPGQARRGPCELTLRRTAASMAHCPFII